MCESCEWEEWREKIQDAIDGEEYRWAFDTMDGILIWIEENKHITPGQKRALSNIWKKEPRYTGRH